MLRKIALLLLVLIPGLLLLQFVWGKVEYKLTTRIGWNSIGNDHPDSLNQLGFRGKTIQPRHSSKEKIILFVGDSQVEANGLPFYFMMENLVQDLLNERDTAYSYKCYSIGSGGYGQDQEFLALIEYFKKYEANKVVLWLTPENDIWNNIFPTHWPVNANPKPTYWLENNILKGPNYQWLEHYSAPNMAAWQKLSQLHNLDTKWESKLPAAYTAIPAAMYKGTVTNQYTLGGEEAIAIEKSHYAIYLSPRSRRMEYGIRLTHLLIDSMQQISAAHHAGFAMFYALNNEFIAMPDSAYHVAVDNKIYTFNKSMLFQNMNAVTTGFDAHIFTLTTKWKQISRQDNHHFNHEAQTEIAHKIVDEILLP